MGRSLAHIEPAPHTLSRHGLSATVPVTLRIGSGRIGSSFAFERAGRWFQSPLSFYRHSGQLALSPGFEKEKYPDFDRPIREQCLFCHSAGPSLDPISCDRCHGNPDAHLRQPSRANIIQPARLPGAARDSVCEQCHLAGAARIPLPGRKESDFTPGLPTEAFFTTHITPSRDLNVVSHSERLAQSRCAQSPQFSATLWCGSCHSAHGPARANTATLCQQCHTGKAHFAQSSCTSCHMPARPTADVHAVYTDHRLQVPGRPEPAPSSSSLQLWRNPTPSLLPRQQGLALAERFHPNDLLLARQLLNSLPEPDSHVSSALGLIALQLDDREAALKHLRNARKQNPRDPWAAYRLGLALNRYALPGATEQFRAAVSLDPAFLDAVIALAQSERTRGNPRAWRQVLEDYLHLMPQHLTVREALRRAP